MDKILFLSDTVINGRTFGKVLSGEFDLDVMRYGEATNVDNYRAMICDLEDNKSVTLGEIHRLRMLTGFRDIPILVSLSPSQKNFARSAGQMGAVGVIIKPFESISALRSLSGAISPVGTKCDINMKIVTPFIDGTAQVIAKMAKEKSVRKSMFLKTNYAMFGDISGVMGLTGDTEGVVAVTFHQDLAFRLIAKMVDCDEDDLSVEDVNDGIGEVVNMIAGTAKRALSGTDYAFDISLPTVIMGNGHQISHQRNVPVIVVVFECDGMPFAVQLCVSNNKSDTSTTARTESTENQEQEPATSAAKTVTAT